MMFCTSAASERLGALSCELVEASRECHYRPPDKRFHRQDFHLQRLHDTGAPQDTHCPAGHKKYRRSKVGKPLISYIAFIASAVLALLSYQRTVAEGGVDCFKCSSRNGSNPACEDPFHNLNYTRVTSPILPDPQPSVIYHTPCYAGRKNRDGLFPASACIKLTGTFDTTGETLVVRHCALDSGSLTQDTELATARMSHCGRFQFEGDLLKGCVLACPENACNSADRFNIVSGRASSMALLPLASILLTGLVLL